MYVNEDCFPAPYLYVLYVILNICRIWIKFQVSYFRQPEIPYALAGCIIEDTIFQQSEIEKLIKSINEDENHVSNNLISIGVFTVPKTEEGSGPDNFDMFSLVIQKCEWTKPKIQEIINDVS